MTAFENTLLFQIENQGEHTKDIYSSRKLQLKISVESSFIDKEEASLTIIYNNICLLLS